MLLAAVLGLALIAIANLTNLTLADVVSRRSDFALRAALGGSRLDLASTEIWQSLAVAVAGGAAGLWAASGLAPAVLSLDPANLLGPRQLATDWRVVACGFGIALVVMMGAVAVPVLRLARPGLAQALTGGARGAIGGPSGGRVRIALVSAQTALGIVLLSSGALVVVTFQRAARIAPGFDPRNVVTAQLRLSEIALPTPESRIAFVERVVERLREAPGIAAASTTLNTFVAGSGGAQSLAFVEERPTPDGAPYRIQSRRVTPGYFETMRIPILKGRDFRETDRAGRQPVTIVSRSFARRFWPGQDPLGRRAKRGVTTKEWAIVIGVVEDVRDVSLDQPPRDTLYTPFLQAGPSPLPVTLVVRTASDPGALVRTIKQAIWQMDPSQPLANVVTLESFLHDSLGPQRFRALLVTGYAVLGLLLATIGTYGVTARSVVDRTREVGVRLALGGDPLRVSWTVAATSLKAVLGGALAGILASAAAGVALAALLPELKEAGWLFSAAAAGALVLAGCAAALIAARGVLSIEPSRALRA
jgi:putative ABC transport system permease protein